MQEPGPATTNFFKEKPLDLQEACQEGRLSER